MQLLSLMQKAGRSPTQSPPTQYLQKVATKLAGIRRHGAHLTLPRHPCAENTKARKLPTSCLNNHFKTSAHLNNPRVPKKINTPTLPYYQGSTE